MLHQWNANEQRVLERLFLQMIVLKVAIDQSSFVAVKIPELHQDTPFKREKNYNIQNSNRK